MGRKRYLYLIEMLKPATYSLQERLITTKARHTPSSISMIKFTRASLIKLLDRSAR